MPRDKYAKFRGHYSDSAFHKKLGGLSNSLRESMVLLFLLLSDPDTPSWIKALSVGVLGYVIFPFDLIPDFLPFGYTDDLAAVAGVLLSVSQHISPELRQRSKNWRK